MNSLSDLSSQEAAVDDAALASRASQDPAAFSPLYRRHFQRVYRYHISRTGNEADAQDLTSQTFMAALEGIASFRGTGSFLAWLFGIARRKLALRFRSRMLEVPLEAASRLPDPAQSTEGTASQRIQLAQISRSLLNMTPERAEALALCLFGDLTAAEAGKVMGKSEAAVKMLVFRGLKELRETYSPALLEEI